MSLCPRTNLTFLHLPSEVTPKVTITFRPEFNFTECSMRHSPPRPKPTQGALAQRPPLVSPSSRGLNVSGSSVLRPGDSVARITDDSISNQSRRSSVCFVLESKDTLHLASSQPNSRATTPPLSAMQSASINPLVPTNAPQLSPPSRSAVGRMDDDSSSESSVFFHQAEGPLLGADSSSSTSTSFSSDSSGPTMRAVSASPKSGRSQRMASRAECPSGSDSDESSLFFVASVPAPSTAIDSKQASPHARNAGGAPTVAVIDQPAGDSTAAVAAESPHVSHHSRKSPVASPAQTPRDVAAPSLDNSGRGGRRAAAQSVLGAELHRRDRPAARTMRPRDVARQYASANRQDAVMRASFGEESRAMQRRHRELLNRMATGEPLMATHAQPKPSLPSNAAKSLDPRLSSSLQRDAPTRSLSDEAPRQLCGIAFGSEPPVAQHVYSNAYVDPSVSQHFHQYAPSLPRRNAPVPTARTPLTDIVRETCLAVRKPPPDSSSATYTTLHLRRHCESCGCACHSAKGGVHRPRGSQSRVAKRGGSVGRARDESQPSCVALTSDATSTPAGSNLHATTRPSAPLPREPVSHANCAGNHHRLFSPQTAVMEKLGAVDAILMRYRGGSRRPASEGEEAQSDEAVHRSSFASPGLHPSIHNNNSITNQSSLHFGSSSRSPPSVSHCASAYGSRGSLDQSTASSHVAYACEVLGRVSHALGAPDELTTSPQHLGPPHSAAQRGRSQRTPQPYRARANGSAVKPRGTSSVQTVRDADFSSLPLGEGGRAPISEFVAVDQSIRVRRIVSSAAPTAVLESRSASAHVAAVEASLLVDAPVPIAHSGPIPQVELVVRPADPSGFPGDVGADSTPTSFAATKTVMSADATEHDATFYSLASDAAFTSAGRATPFAAPLPLAASKTLGTPRRDLRIDSIIEAAAAAVRRSRAMRERRGNTSEDF